MRTTRPDAKQRRSSGRCPAGAAIALVALLAGSGASAQASRPLGPLPPPTGPYAVGRTIFRWTDSTRPELLSADSSERRRVVVYLWYPSRADGAAPAAYIPDFSAWRAAVGDSALGRLAGAGRLTVHAREDAPLVDAPRRLPLLLFSPGIGETALNYATVLEELASHGYVVAALDHPYDALGAEVASGRVVPFAAQAWAAALAVGGDSAVGYFKARVAVGAADTRFALDALTHGAHLPGAARPLAARLDLARIGAFGHSLGGMTAVRFCQLDARARACMNQDSDYRGVPLFDFGDGARLSQPFMFFASDHSLILARHTPPPTAADLAAAKLTRAEYDAKRRRQQAAQDSALAHVAAGSWRVGVETPGFTHRSFMDAPLLGVAPDSAAAALLNLRIVRTYTRAFFDRCLRGSRATALDAPTPLDSAVVVDRFRGGRALR